MTALILSHAIAFVFGVILGFGGIWLLAVALDPMRGVKRAARHGKPAAMSGAGDKYRP